MKSSVPHSGLGCLHKKPNSSSDAHRREMVMSSDTQADGQTGRVALTQGLTMAHNFYSTNFTNLRVISLGRKPGSEWGMGTWSSMERDGKISTRKKSVSAKPGRVAHASGQCFYWVPECLREASCQQVPRGDWTSHQKYDKNQDGFVYSPGTSIHEYKNTLLTHLPPKHNQVTKNISHVNWHF